MTAVRWLTLDVWSSWSEVRLSFWVVPVLVPSRFHEGFCSAS